MSAPTKPEPTPTSTPPASIPTEDPRDKTLELMDRVIAEKEAELQLLRAKVNTPAPEPAKPPVAADDWFKDPAKHTDELIKKNLAESVGPLNEFVNVQRRVSALANYRNIVSKHPNVSKFWPFIEAEFDRVANEFIQKNDVNENIVVGEVQRQIALFAMNDPLKYAELTGKKINPEPEPKPVIPPNIPSSASEPPAAVDDKNKAPVLTENEMRLARERWPNLSHADAYKKYADLRSPGSFIIEPKKKA